MRGILLHVPGLLFLLAGASPDPAAATELEPTGALADEIEPAPKLEVGTSPLLAGKIGAVEEGTPALAAEIESAPGGPRDIEPIAATKSSQSAVNGRVYPGRTWNTE